MRYFFDWVNDNRALVEAISLHARKRNIPLYVVGGILRDIIAGREKESIDMDFCLKGNAISFAQEISGLLKAGFVVLDRIHGCARVVKKIGKSSVTFDFTDFRGKTLEEDLLHRDFTINSLALALPELLKALKETKTAQAKRKIRGLLIDPYGGRKDIDLKIVRAVNKNTFDEDPLRMMRAFSIASILDFGIDAGTLKLLKDKTKKISFVSPERVRDELFKAFSGNASFRAFSALDAYGMLEIIFPEIKSMKRLDRKNILDLNVWRHSLKTLEELEALMKTAGRSPGINDYLKEELSSGRRRFELIKLAALLHDIGKPGTFRKQKKKITFHGHERIGGMMIEKAGMRLKLANDEVRRLKLITYAHLRPGYLSESQQCTPRAKFRFFRDSGPEALSVLLISLADQRATVGNFATKESRARHEKTVRRLIKEYFAHTGKQEREKLIDGNDIMRHFHLEPSPLIGKVLRELEELQAIKKVTTKEEALRKAAAIIKKASI